MTAVDKPMMMGQISPLQFPQIWPCWSPQHVSFLGKESPMSSEASLWRVPSAWPGSPCPLEGKASLWQLLPGLAGDLALARQTLKPQGCCC